MIEIMLDPFPMADSNSGSMEGEVATARVFRTSAKASGAWVFGRRFVEKVPEKNQEPRCQARPGKVVSR